jgi:hypothetical protein
MSEDDKLMEKIKKYEIFFKRLKIYVLEQEYNHSLMALKNIDKETGLIIKGEREAYNDVLDFIKKEGGVN